ncbi:uncharacterized protein LOC126370396 [Pectinophora gossypiella]|uniref:uncharacterized protein LOC126370396 n=1 Tax=Pectinophora gossypiella TaxID=13191 RepID=UPI00214F478E|nr:uncharacterized protein LOC126370396 [Pectinophora gossypiella]
MLKEVISASLGLSTDQYGYWDGLNILDPFETPEAAALVYVDGIPNLSDFFQAENVQKYSLILDEEDFQVFSFVKDRIRKHSSGGSVLNVALISLTYDVSKHHYNQLTLVKNVLDVFGEIQVPKVPKLSLNSLKYSIEEDYQFLSELEALKAVTSAVENTKPDNKIDFYDFWFSSLHSLADYHGPASQQVKEAIKLLST